MCVNSYLWRSTLIRSSKESIRLKLAADYKDFELALMPLCSPNYGYTLSKLIPESYEQLRDFPSILSMENEQLIQVRFVVCVLCIRLPVIKFNRVY